MRKQCQRRSVGGRSSTMVSARMNLIADSAEDDLVSNDYPGSVKPHELFQDSVVSKAEDDYVDHSTMSKRFSDYIPTAVLKAYMDEGKAKLGNQFNKGGSESHQKSKAYIPPPIPALQRGRH